MTVQTRKSSKTKYWREKSFSSEITGIYVKIGQFVLSIEFISKLKRIYRKINPNQLNRCNDKIEMKTQVSRVTDDKKRATNDKQTKNVKHLIVITHDVCTMCRDSDTKFGNKVNIVYQSHAGLKKQLNGNTFLNGLRFLFAFELFKTKLFQIGMNIGFHCMNSSSFYCHYLWLYWIMSSDCVTRSIFVFLFFYIGNLVLDFSWHNASFAIYRLNLYHLWPIFICDH